MKLHDLVFVILKLSAVYLLLQFVISGADGLNAILHIDEYNYTAASFSLTVAFIYFIAFVILWFKSSAISKKIVENTGNNKVDLNIAAGELQNIGFVIIGIFMLVSSVPLITKIATIISLTENGTPYDYLLSDIVSVVVQFVLGAVLVLRAEGLSNIIKVLRGRK